MKTLLVSAVLLLTVPVGAKAGDRLFHDFAACAGMLSAELAHQWLLQQPQSAETEKARDAFVDLLESVTTPANTKQALALRIDAKHAHAMLLRRSVFETAAKDAAWARKRARQSVSACAALLPDQGLLVPRV